MDKKGYVFVNLLPYREVIKKEQIKQLSLFMLFFAIVAGFIVFLVYSAFAVEIESQASRNKFIEERNKKLDQEIKEIADLKTQITSTLSKRKVVENLQTNRSDSVSILNDLSLQLPDGVVLRSVTQDGLKIVINGRTNSNNKVSNYMTNLSNTNTFTNPQLIQISASGAAARPGAPAGTTGNSDFTLNIFLKPKGVTVDQMLINANKQAPARVMAK